MRNPDLKIFSHYETARSVANTLEISGVSDHAMVETIRKGSEAGGYVVRGYKGATCYPVTRMRYDALCAIYGV